MSQGYKNNSRKKNYQETDYPFDKEQINRRRRNAEPVKEKVHKEKLPATVDEQIGKLRERGCIVEDEEFARETLTDINYFRFFWRRTESIGRAPSLSRLCGCTTLTASSGTF